MGGGFRDNSVTQSQDHFEALVNLITATANDCGAMATLVETNKLLTEKLAKALDTITTLTAHLGKLAPSEPNKRGTHYCWTCGCKCNHNNKDCTSPSEGHKTEATFHKKRGGSATTLRGRRS